MSLEDLNYYRRRAAIERSRAEDAPTPVIASVHMKLAGLYEELVNRVEPRAANDHALALPPHMPQPDQSGIQR